MLLISQKPEEVDWLVLGDFNLIRRPGNRNKEGENLMEMMLFNEVISALGLMKFLFRGENLPGLTSRPHLFWKSLTGPSLLTLGCFPILILPSQPLI